MVEELYLELVQLSSQLYLLLLVCMMDIQDHINADKEGFMRLSKKELLEVDGGIKITGVILNGALKAINIFTDLGRALGSAIRRMSTNSMCRV